ncbi:MAG: hypothetical protein CSA29_03370 [Desulfobacterales bacterium]|nr:MAG: hypothetical protein CSA29_03370 [Desulfobacterales bacterium]
MKTIDLNCDMGESFGNYKIGMDKAVMAYITSANVACGWHAGDPMVMDDTVRMAKTHGVGVGAHPGYPDLMGFGRRKMNLSPAEVRQYLVYQIAALQGFCKVHGVTLRHVKPHGALYLDAVENKETARAVAEAILSLDPALRFVALAGKKGELMRQMGEALGLKVIFEAFPDRAYTPEGTLVPRHQPGAVITDPGEVAKRAMDMAEGHVIAVDGSCIELDVQTLCVHGDNPDAVNLVRQIRTGLEKNGVQVVTMSRKYNG